MNNRRFWAIIMLVLIAMILNVVLFLVRTPSVSEHIFPSIPPKPEEIFAAVEKYCEVNNCQGEASTIPGPSGFSGDNGKNGEDGKDSKVPGPPGPASTVPGPQGIQGEPGEPGRNLEIRCNTETQQFETRYDGDSFWTPMEGSDCIVGKKRD